MKSPLAREKILSLDALVERVKSARRRDEQIVFTNGCFDLLHSGHVRGFEEASRLGDRLIVAINSDASVRRLKGPGRPLQNARTRREIVAALACVDWVVSFSGDTPLRTIRALRPDILVKGGDWAPAEIVGREDVEGWGGRVQRLKIVRGQSTTSMLRSIRRHAPRAKR
jgi:D-beta-D-heptose 7-phosphate kinase / D-beta-D-heptose 1-phosphate adenosyltransferase